MTIASARWARVAAMALLGGTFGTAALLAEGGGRRTSFGYVVEDRRSLGFSEAGRIERVHVVLGDAVRAGDVLVELDAAEIDAELEALEAEGVSLANQARLRAVAVARAEEDAHAGVVATAEEARSARAKADALRTAVLETEARVSRGLGGVDALTELRVASTSSAALAASLSATAATLSRRSPVAATLTPEAAAGAEEEAVRRRADALRVRRARLVVRAPVDGRVSRLAHAEGDVADAGETVIEISRPSSVDVVACVDSASTVAIREGQRAGVRTLDGRSTAEARVVAVGPAFEVTDERCRVSLYRPRSTLPVVLVVESGDALVPNATVAVAWGDTVADSVPSAVVRAARAR